MERVISWMEHSKQLTKFINIENRFQIISFYGGISVWSSAVCNYRIIVGFTLDSICTLADFLLEIIILLAGTNASGRSWLTNFMISVFLFV